MQLLLHAMKYNMSDQHCRMCPAMVERICNVAPHLYATMHLTPACHHMLAGNDITCCLFVSLTSSPPGEQEKWHKLCLKVAFMFPL